jgi:hypothetical protein
MARRRRRRALGALGEPITGSLLLWGGAALVAILALGKKKPDEDTGPTGPKVPTDAEAVAASIAYFDSLSLDELVAYRRRVCVAASAPNYADLREACEVYRYYESLRGSPEARSEAEEAKTGADFCGKLDALYKAVGAAKVSEYYASTPCADPNMAFVARELVPVVLASAFKGVSVTATLQNLRCSAPNIPAYTKLVGDFMDAARNMAGGPRCLVG